MSIGALAAPTRGEALLVAATAAYLANQVRHTWRRRNAWPFCSYDMFSYPLGARFPQPRVQLADMLGTTDPLPVYGLLPVEFFRAVAIVDDVFYEPSDTELQDRFAARMLRRLNQRPWHGFDERRASIRPRTSQGWTGLRLLDVTIDLADYSPAGDQPLHEVSTFYSYQWPA